MDTQSETTSLSYGIGFPYQFQQSVPFSMTYIKTQEEQPTWGVNFGIPTQAHNFKEYVPTPNMITTIKPSAPLPPYFAPTVPMFFPYGITDAREQNTEPFLNFLQTSLQSNPQVYRYRPDLDVPTVMGTPSMSTNTVDLSDYPPSTGSSQSSDTDSVVEQKILRFKCCWGECQESFTTRSGLAAHCTSHIEAIAEGGKLHCHWRKCPQMYTTFDDLKELGKHMGHMSHIGQVVYIPKSLEEKEKRNGTVPSRKQYGCVICGRMFNDSSNCKKHEKIHDTNRERFHCSEPGCSRSYSTKTDLNIHAKVHKGDYTYKCQFPGCAKAFVRLSELYAHERKHDNVLPHHCTHCGERFKDIAKLRRHIKKDHE